MNLMKDVGHSYKVNLDPSYKRGNFKEKWHYFEIMGKCGMIWPYNDTHLVVAFFHAWRSRVTARGETLWIPGNRSRQAGRFQAIAKSDCVVVQSCDEAVCLKVPNKYLNRALKAIDGRQKRRVNRQMQAKHVLRSSQTPACREVDVILASKTN